MKKILAASMFLAIVLTGCNTVKGLGEDVSSAGSAVSNTAEDTKTKTLILLSVFQKTLSTDRVS